MPYYKYVAKNLNGETLSGEIFAENHQMFYAELRNQQLFCIKKTVRDKKQKTTTKKLKMKELVIIARQFGTMLNSGVSIIKCIDILHEQAENKHNKEILFNVYEQVQKGNALSTALQANDKAFPNFFISMIEAGEQSGTLEQSFLKMATHYEKEIKIQDKVKTAMIYPIILGAVSIIVVLILMLFVIPTFFEMFEGAEQDLPWNTRLLINGSNMLIVYWKQVLIATIALIGSIVCVVQAKSAQSEIDKMKLQVPVAGKLNKIILSARFAETLSTLYSSGLSLIDSIEIAGRVINNSFLNEGLEKVKQDIAKGIPLSEALSQLGVFPIMLSNMILIGEESGQLDEILEKTAQFYEQEADTAIQKMISLLEPMMIVILGLVVGFIIASILPPMYSMYQNISG